MNLRDLQVVLYVFGKKEKGNFMKNVGSNLKTFRVAVLFFLLSLTNIFVYPVAILNDTQESLRVSGGGFDCQNLDITKGECLHIDNPKRGTISTSIKVQHTDPVTYVSHDHYASVKNAGGHDMVITDNYGMHIDNKKDYKKVCTKNYWYTSWKDCSGTW